MQFRRLASALLVMAALTGGSAALAASPEDTMVITLKGGDVVVALRPDLAPKHVAQLKALVREGAYDNVAFHRVIDDFMAQTGDVQFGDMESGFNQARAGTGGSDKPNLRAEFSKQPFTRGVVGMARAQDPNSANSQFFIMFGPAPSLDGKYTVVGQVEKGMELVDGIKKGNAAENGVVDRPDRMIKVRIQADGK